jgi:hypothetical protein
MILPGKITPLKFLMMAWIEVAFGFRIFGKMEPADEPEAITQEDDIRSDRSSILHEMQRALNRNTKRRIDRKR